MDVRSLLRLLSVGSSVAEFDDELERHFIETETFRALVEDRADVIAGDKGTGKTAIFKILIQRYAQLPELANVEVIAGFNPNGSPVFQRLAEGDVLTEGQYISIWKAYLFALAANWLLDLEDDLSYPELRALDETLRKVGLRSPDDSPNTVFSKLLNLTRRIGTVRSAEIAISLTPAGLPLLVPKVEFGEAVEPTATIVAHEEMFGVLARALEELDLTIWIVMDRLDEAFQGFPAAEVPALRALLRSYLDLAAFPRLRLKLFVRRDLFRKVIEGGFVNLTHVNARKIEISWSLDDLWDLLCRRIRGNSQLLTACGISDADCETVFSTVFPEQVDVGDRKPTTWTWMMGRIRDGNDVRPPRNLIDLVGKAQADQLRREERHARQRSPDEPLIESDSIKRGLAKLSAERVEDTLLAEAGPYAEVIKRFRGGKAEHSLATIAATLGIAEAEAEEEARKLHMLGFLEPAGGSYKVPIIYRDGLSITQGKAF